MKIVCFVLFVIFGTNDLLCAKSIVSNEICLIERRFLGGEDINAVRNDLFSFDSLLLSDNEKKIYYKLAMDISVRSKDLENARKYALKFIDLGLDVAERKKTYFVLVMCTIRRDGNQNYEEVENELNNLLPKSDKYEIMFSIFDYLSRYDCMKIPQYFQNLKIKDEKRIKIGKYFLAVYYSQNKEYEKSEQLCQSLYEDKNVCIIFRDNLNDAIGFLLGFVLVRQDKFDAAADVFWRMTSMSQNEDVKSKSHLGLGYCYSKLGKYDKAIFQYKQVLKQKKICQKHLEEATDAIKRLERKE